ncbi:hypothetical protein MAR_010854 [Mya arenaria]|uniref:Uncharacterized protein n=1 Tax=Mya arenaria TaxID=6604 RepID=A0ABY7FSE2_MYAAR|nr:hypothetical protein MAR_010854 [Mya arenaria]
MELPEVSSFTVVIYSHFLMNIVVNVEDRFLDLPLLQKFEVLNTRNLPGKEPTCHGEDGINILMRTDVWELYKMGSWSRDSEDDRGITIV